MHARSPGSTDVLILFSSQSNLQRHRTWFDSDCQSDAASNPAGDLLQCPVRVQNTGTVRLLSAIAQGSNLGGAAPVPGPSGCHISEIPPGNASSCMVTITVQATDFLVDNVQLQVVVDASTVFAAITTTNSTIADLDLSYARTLSVELIPSVQAQSE